MNSGSIAIGYLYALWPKAGCDPKGAREKGGDKDCNDEIRIGSSGYCNLEGKELGGHFKYFLFSPRKPGEMIQFDDHIFQMKWVETTNKRKMERRLNFWAKKIMT